METLTVTLHSEHARRLLEDLQLLGALTIQTAAVADASLLQPEPELGAPTIQGSNTPVPPRERTFNALSYSTKGFKFNRDEANER